MEAAWLVLGAATDHGPHGGIEAEAFGVVDILVAGQSAVDRLAQEGEQAVLGVLSGAGVVQAGRRRRGQAEGVVEFAVGEESGVAGDGGAVELQLDLAVEIDAEGVVLAVTHWVPRSVSAGSRRKRWDFQGKWRKRHAETTEVIWEIQVFWFSPAALGRCASRTLCRPGFTRRLCTSCRRAAAKRSSSQSPPVLAAAVAQEDPFAEAAWKEVRGVLDDKVGRLPEVLRAPLILCYFDGVSRDEAAEKLGCSRRTLMRRLEKAHAATAKPPRTPGRGNGRTRSGCAVFRRVG